MWLFYWGSYLQDSSAKLISWPAFQRMCHLLFFAKNVFMHDKITCNTILASLRWNICKAPLALTKFDLIHNWWLLLEQVILISFRGESRFKIIILKSAIWFFSFSAYFFENSATKNCATSIILPCLHQSSLWNCYAAHLVKAPMRLPPDKMPPTIISMSGFTSVKECIITLKTLLLEII